MRRGQQDLGLTWAARYTLSLERGLGRTAPINPTGCATPRSSASFGDQPRFFCRMLQFSVLTMASGCLLSREEEEHACVTGAFYDGPLLVLVTTTKGRERERENSPPWISTTETMN
jgi:hypothetical protein